LILELSRTGALAETKKNAPVQHYNCIGAFIFLSLPNWQDCSTIVIKKALARFPVVAAVTGP
jgi:hypothetical protein